ncbi:TrkH family potassium uptake protein [Thermodesulforhabdus norvegica]|uniref:Trk system potassium uptake protein TrkH n=1 Tax=Thermodesulforhabdus norvegica TaxID=39841 RepID=A0A1I4SG40_9BACT|nr:TrkH family potassium uptake protein [Thermodesulforhabdus norvegica]SFM63344.1 trk system potassium uptake protein TrkH [Thermodesulforhabdus norvegica]
MHWGYMSKALGGLFISVSMTMIFPIIAGLWYSDDSFGPLLKSMATGLTGGSILFAAGRKAQVVALGHREGMAIVTLGWIGAGILGALPFYFSRTLGSFVDCFFESVSGFTTTGASVLTDIESVAPGILFWRSLTHWLGGMGIIVFSLAILPFLGAGGMQLYKAEVPSPVPDKLRPRIRDTALLLWKVYLLFTVLETVLLMFGGMNLFDALCHTFGTLATGGFSTKNASIAHFRSAYVDAVIIFFMFVAGVNFSLHYQLLIGKPGRMFRDPEFRFFSALVLSFVVFTTLAVHGNVYSNLTEALRYSLFQVISIITTTGYATADYEAWPFLPQAILFISMFIGACAGSTGGGMKCMRVMLLLKHAYRELFRLIHPHGVSRIKLQGQQVSQDVLNSVLGFFVLYMLLYCLGVLLVAATGVDILTSFASVAATIGNIGPGLGTVGPTENYFHMPYFAKGVLTFCMILGRLEIFTVIVLFVPEFWRK